MKFIDYIKTLMPTFSKDDITQSCELSQASLTTHTIPAMAIAKELWKSKKFKSEEVNDYIKYFERSVGITRSEGMFGTIHGALVNGVSILVLLSDESKEVYSNTEANISMTYLKTTIVRIIEACEYANTYSRRFLNYVYYMETEEAGQTSKLSPAEFKWLKDGFIDYCACIKLMQLKIDIIKMHLNNLPNAIISDITEKTFSATIGSKLDPFNMRNLSARTNPFYLLGMWEAEWQDKRYKAAKLELELLQLRKLNLEKQMEKNPDAKLEKEIAYMQDRVSGLLYDIAKKEEDYK